MEFLNVLTLKDFWIELINCIGFIGLLILIAYAIAYLIVRMIELIWP